LRAFRETANEVLRWIGTAAKKTKRFYEELRRYGLCRTFRYQFELLAKRRPKSEEAAKKSRSGDDRAVRSKQASGPSLAYVKHMEAEQRKASLRQDFVAGRLASRAAPPAAAPSPNTKEVDRSCSTRLDGPR
jgi:hypothetical protein